MDTKEINFYKLFDKIALEFKKQLSTIPTTLGVELSLRDIHILEYVGLECKTMSEITSILDVTAGTLTTIIDVLVSKKILKRERNENIDRRKVFISLDTIGKEFYSKIKEVQIFAINSMLKNLNEEEIQKAYNTMNKMYQGLKEYSK